MHKFRSVLMIVALVVTQQVFADDAMSADSSGNKTCDAIAKTCLAAGFVKTESATKGIWGDCMEPVILGKAVAGVTVEPADVKSCRAHKIEKLKMELKEFQKVK